MKTNLMQYLSLSLFRQSTSTCFRHICSPSSGGILYICNNWYVLYFWVDCLLAFHPNPANRQSTKKQNMYQLLCVCVYIYIYIYISGFGGLDVACWPLVPKFAGSNPAEAVGFLRTKKVLSTPSFRGEVKLSVPCCRFAACKRSLELRGSRILGQICQNISRLRRVPPSAAGGLSLRWMWRHLVEKVGTSKGGGKKWQPTPKNLPRMQHARAIPVAWLGSGSC